jgi:hypothetical protein
MTHTAPALEPIIHRPGRDMDVNTTWDHIGRRTLALAGARNLAYSNENSYVQFDAMRKRVFVQLAADDTYSVETGTIRKVDHLPTYTVKAQTHGVYAEQLAETVRTMLGI